MPAINHKGIVTCRGILLDNRSYKRGDQLLPDHEALLLRLFREYLDLIDTNGWIQVSGGQIHLVLLSSTEPYWISH